MSSCSRSVNHHLIFLFPRRLCLRFFCCLDLCPRQISRPPQCLFRTVPVKIWFPCLFERGFVSPVSMSSIVALQENHFATYSHCLWELLLSDFFSFFNWDTILSSLFGGPCHGYDSLLSLAVSGGHHWNFHVHCLNMLFLCSCFFKNCKHDMVFSQVPLWDAIVSPTNFKTGISWDMADLR